MKPLKFLFMLLSFILYSTGIQATTPDLGKSSKKIETKESIKKSGITSNNEVLTFLSFNYEKKFQESFFQIKKRLSFKPKYISLKPKVLKNNGYLCEMNYWCFRNKLKPFYRC